MTDDNKPLIKRMSASSYKTLEMCWFKWYLTYIHKIPFKDSFATSNGSMLHEVWELWGRAKRLIDGFKKDLKKTNKKKEKAKIMKNIARLEKFLDYEGRVYHYYKNKYEPWKFIPDYEKQEKLCSKCEFFDKTNNFCNVVGDNVDDFKGCPRKEMRESLRLVNAVFDQKNNPLNQKVLEFEERFYILLDNGVKIYGFMDLVIEIDKDTIEIRDWKTGKFQLDNSEIYEDMQMRMYALAVSILYPQYKYVICTLDYPRYYNSTGDKQGEVTASFDQEDHEETKRRIKVAWDMVHNEDLLKRSPSFKCQFICVGYEECNRLWKEITGKDDKIGK